MRFEALFFMVHVQGGLANWTYGVIALWSAGIVGLAWIWFRAHFLPINRPAPLERPCSCHISEFSNRLYMLTIHAWLHVIYFFYIYIPHFPWVGKVFFSFLKIFHGV